jgi:hypothetical protein
MLWGRCNAMTWSMAWLSHDLVANGNKLQYLLCIWYSNFRNKRQANGCWISSSRSDSEQSFRVDNYLLNSDAAFVSVANVPGCLCQTGSSKWGTEQFDAPNMTCYIPHLPLPALVRVKQCNFFYLVTPIETRTVAAFLQWLGPGQAVSRGCCLASFCFRQCTTRVRASVRTWFKHRNLQISWNLKRIWIHTELVKMNNNNARRRMHH